MKRFIASFAALIALLTSALFLPVSAAFAHDEIVATTPSANSQVAPGQLKVSVTFNEPAMQVGNNEGIEIQVTSPDGTATVLPCLTVDGATIWAVDDAQAEGSYTVDWRSVSNDGHANSGSFKFDVAAGAAAGETADLPADCSAATSAAETGATATPIDPSAMPTDIAPLMASEPKAASGLNAADSASSSDSSVGLTATLAIVSLLAVAAAVFYGLRLRNKRREETLTNS